MIAAFSAADQLRRRPAPVNTSIRRTGSGICLCSEIDMCRSPRVGFEHHPSARTPKGAAQTPLTAKVPSLRMKIVKRSDDVKGFVVLPRRWVVERTFSWFGRNRRLAKDFENLAETLATFVILASIQLAVRRLARA